MLYNDTLKNPVPADFLLFEKFSPSETQRAMADSLVVLSLPGDTPTTDRIYNAFESVTIIACLSHDKEPLLRNLPFHFAVEWESLILWIDTDQFVVSPLAAISAAVDGMSPAEVKRRLTLMLLFQKEVTWTHPNSRASQNVLQGAMQLKAAVMTG
jgi:hypothetical protein